MFFVGIIMLAFRSREGTKPHPDHERPAYTVKPLESILKTHKRGKETAFVIDSSGAIDYKNQLQKIIDYYGQVYIPKRVMNELKGDSKLRKIIQKNQDKIKQINPREHKNYQLMRHILETGKVPKGVSDNKLEYFLGVLEPELDSRARKAGLDPEKPQDKIKILKRDYKLSKGDVEVVLTALINAKNNKKTAVLSQDTHIRDTLDSLRNQFPKLKQYIDYIEYRKYPKTKKTQEVA